MKNILVVGGAGFIGSHMVKMLIESSFQVSILDNLSTGHKESVLGGKFYFGEMQDQKLVGDILKTDKIDLVMHFASNIEVGESTKNPRKYYLNNLSNTIFLINTMLDCDVKNFIFSSTAAIFGIPKTESINESSPSNPINVYGKTKYMIEEILADYDRAYSFKSICFRYFNAAGSDPDGEIGELHDPETHLIPLLINAYLKNKKFYIYGDDYPTKDGTCVRDYLHVNDICDAHLKGIDFLKNKKESCSFNLGNGSGYTVNEVISALESIVDKKLEIEVASPREGDPPVLVADSSLAKKILGWQPRSRNLTEIIKDALNFYEKRK